MFDLSYQTRVWDCEDDHFQLVLRNYPRHDGTFIEHEPAMLRESGRGFSFSQRRAAEIMTEEGTGRSTLVHTLEKSTRALVLDANVDVSSVQALYIGLILALHTETLRQVLRESSELPYPHGCRTKLGRSAVICD